MKKDKEKKEEEQKVIIEDDEEDLTNTDGELSSPGRRKHLSQKLLTDYSDDKTNNSGNGRRKYNSRAFTVQLKKFLESPFEDDKKFALNYISHLSRDYIHDAEKVLIQLFYDRIFKILMENHDETNRFKALDILCNLTQSDV